MKKGFFLSLAWVSLLWETFFPICFAQQSIELKSLNFRQQGDISQLEMVFDRDGAIAEKLHLSEAKQVVVDLKDVVASQRVMRAFDTSEFSGSVVFVSAYTKPEKSSDIRITLQLRDNVRTLLKRGPRRIILEIENRFGVFGQQEITDNETVIAEEGSDRIHIPKSGSLEDILENLTLSGRKKYIGKRISLDVKDVPVSDILRMLAEASGFNIILTKEVQGLPPLTLNLTKVPWDQALDNILNLNKLVAKKNGIILTIQSLESAMKEEERKAAVRKLAEQEELLVTKVFPISYAETKNLTSILEKYLTKTRGAISEDVRTNSLIIKDTSSVLEKIRKIIEVLDTQTPQVLIESKIVEVSESHSKEIGFQKGINFGYDPIGSVSRQMPSRVGVDPTSGIDGGPGFTFSSAPVADESNARSLFGLMINQFGRLTNLNFTLQMLETESKGKIISSPKVVTQNKKKATLRSTKTDAFAKTTGTGADAQTTFEETQASIVLEVTPQVTNEGSIVLEMSLRKEDFGARILTNGPRQRLGSDVQTSVLVENGGTIVLGGLYESSKSNQHSGIPFLKDIPLLGWFFRTPYAPSSNKREIIIFITPRIVNQEEAGLVDRG